MNWARINTLVCATLAALCAVVVGLLAFSSWCAFIAGFPYEDYSRYYNMLWNTGHGRWFQYVMHGNYLATHLSFTLVLLSPFVVLIKFPFALSVLQLLCVVAGAVFVGLTARRHGMPCHYYLAFVLFYLAFHLTQYVQLDEFHGVALYMLLIPWLYYCLSYARRFVWIPFILTLLLREEAGLMTAPLLVFFAWREKWRAGWIYAGVAVAYAAGGTAFLYSHLVRHDPDAYNLDAMSSNGILAGFAPEYLWYRATSWVWVVLAVLPFMFRGGKAVVIIPSVAVIVTICSGSWRQFSLLYHYPAVVMATVTVAMMESARLHLKEDGRFRNVLRLGVPAYLVVLTVVSYYVRGVLPGALEHRKEFNRVDAEGLHAMQVAAKHIPADGVLFATHDWSAFVSGRQYIVTTHTYERHKHDVDIVFCRFGELKKLGFVAHIESGAFGVRYFDHNVVVVLQRGYETAGNAGLLEAVKENRVLFASSAVAAGQTSALERGLVKDVYVPEAGLVRHWCGDGRRAPINLTCGGSATLAPGKYRAEFHFKAVEPRRKVRGSWGMLGLHRFDEGAALVEAPIEQGAPAFRVQALEFSLDAEMRVEPRVTGADAELWLDRVVFVPQR